MIFFPFPPPYLFSSLYWRLSPHWYQYTFIFMSSVLPIFFLQLLLFLSSSSSISSFFFFIIYSNLSLLVFRDMCTIKMIIKFQLYTLNFTPPPNFHNAQTLWTVLSYYCYWHLRWGPSTFPELSYRPSVKSSTLNVTFSGKLPVSSRNNYSLSYLTAYIFVLQNRI